MNPAQLATATPIDAANTVPRALVLQAERHGAKPLITFPRDGEVLTYEGLTRLAQNGSRRLRHAHGLLRGESAAIYLGNCAAGVKAWFAFLFAGLVDVPINHEFKKAMLLFGLDKVQARALVTNQEGLVHLLDPEVAHYLPKLKLLLLTGEVDDALRARLLAVAGCPTVLALDELLADEAAGGALGDSVWEAIDAASAAVIRFTSGTTGPAKGVVQSHLHVLAKSMVHNRILDYSDQDTFYSPFPLHHNLASINGLIGTLQVGGTLVSVPRFSASRYWTDAAECGATLAHLLQSVAPLLMAQPESEADTRHRVRMLWTGGPDPDFEARFRTQWVQVYALGEVGAISWRRGSVKGDTNTGPPLPEMEVRIVDALDRPLPANTTGEIVIRPHHQHRVMLAYHDDLPATTRAFRNLWFHTGDAGMLSDAGELHFQGRIGDTIRRRGVNMSSEQIEDELRRHAEVLDCGVIAVPADGDQEVHACILWRTPPADAVAAYRELAAFASARLAREYLPRFFESVDDLPRTGTGKVQKAVLRTRARFGPTWDRALDTWHSMDRPRRER
ncbi:MAG: AMP-binding protein [Lautropia sp.]